MEAKNFNILSIEEKGKIVFTEGTFLDVRCQYNKYKIAIYNVSNIFIEVFYCEYTNEIKNIKAIENNSDWNGYLSSINLNHLI